MAIDTEKELFEIKKIVKENNEILHRLQRKSRWATFFTIVRWIIIAFIAFGVYTFVQPIVQTFITGYGTIVESANQIKEIKDKSSGFNFFDLFSGSNSTTSSE
jgi:ABC-type iron transport system FetAB permease component